jgi:hypothetical protein
VSRVEVIVRRFKRRRPDSREKRTGESRMWDGTVTCTVLYSYIKSLPLSGGRRGFYGVELMQGRRRLLTPSIQESKGDHDASSSEAKTRLETTLKEERRLTGDECGHFHFPQNSK